MPKFRKRPVIIEAFQYTDDNIDYILEWLNHEYHLSSGGVLFIHTLEGQMHASPGDWIIKGVKGEFYPCKPDIFEATYEPVDEAKG